MISLGEKGENLVANHLKSKGWEILAQRWTCRWSDLDIVASDRPSKRTLLKSTIAQI
jgi:putative endonuclease